jgi:hypothetical protein
MSKSTLTRRALVASTAAMPAAAALGLPAVAQAAAEPDPIFALIEKYREAFDQHGAALDAEDEDQSTLACHAQAKAAQELCHTPPTTLAGLAAVLSFVINVHDADDDILDTFADNKDEPKDENDTCMWPFFRTLLRSAEQMARTQS